MVVESVHWLSNDNINIMFRLTKRAREREREKERERERERCNYLVAARGRLFKCRPQRHVAVITTSARCDNVDVEDHLFLLMDDEGRM